MKSYQFGSVLHTCNRPCRLQLVCTAEAICLPEFLNNERKYYVK